MNYKVPSFDDRRLQIESVDDITKQIKLAKAYAARIRSAEKKAPTFEGKIHLNKQLIEAEKVLRRLRAACFDIEDEIMNSNASK